MKIPQCEYPAKEKCGLCADPLKKIFNVIWNALDGRLDLANIDEEATFGSTFVFTKEKTSRGLQRLLQVDTSLFDEAGAAEAAAAEAAAALAAHVAASDPHPGYQKESEYNQAGGYVGLVAIPTNDEILRYGAGGIQQHTGIFYEAAGDMSLRAAAAVLRFKSAANVDHGYMVHDSTNWSIAQLKSGGAMLFLNQGSASGGTLAHRWQVNNTNEVAFDINHDKNARFYGELTVDSNFVGGGQIRAAGGGVFASTYNDENDIQLLTLQQAAISDSVGGDEADKINEILAMLRVHGLIAT